MDSAPADGIFKKDGVYYLRLLFPWETQFVNIALHGALSYADALKTFQLLYSRIKSLPAYIP
ncbi:hypothetical protein [Pedosphaera parvula]|nr:hypothetical protein [Pedosphaera parvula]